MQHESSLKKLFNKPNLEVLCYFGQDTVFLLIIFAGNYEYIRSIQNRDFLKKPPLFYFRLSHFDIRTIFFTIFSQNLIWYIFPNPKVVLALCDIYMYPKENILLQNNIMICKFFFTAGLMPKISLYTLTIKVFSFYHEVLFKKSSNTQYILGWFLVGVAGMVVWGVGGVLGVN